MLNHVCFVRPADCQKMSVIVLGFWWGSALRYNCRGKCHPRCGFQGDRGAQGVPDDSTPSPYFLLLLRYRFPLRPHHHCSAAQLKKRGRGIVHSRHCRTEWWCCTSYLLLLPPSYLPPTSKAWPENCHMMAMTQPQETSDNTVMIQHLRFCQLFDETFLRKPLLWLYQMDRICNSIVRLFVSTSNFNVKANPSKSCSSSCISSRQNGNSHRTKLSPSYCCFAGGGKK